MKKWKWSDIACVVLVMVVEALSILCVIESGNPDLPLWLTRLMRWVGLFCIMGYSYAAGAVVEDRKWEDSDE